MTRPKNKPKKKVMIAQRKISETGEWLNRWEIIRTDRAIFQFEVLGFISYIAKRDDLFLIDPFQEFNLKEYPNCEFSFYFETKTRLLERLACMKETHKAGGLLYVPII